MFVSPGGIQANESLFYYEPGSDHDSHADATYQPAFTAGINPNLDQDLVAQVCGDNPFCIFDFQVTGNQAFAEASLQTFVQFEEAQNSTMIGTN